MGTPCQTLVAAAPGDAVTSSALEIRRLLRKLGPSEIYALHIHEDLVGDIRPLSECPRLDASDSIVVHVSMGDPDWFGWVLSQNARFIVSYHNISPATYFSGWDDDTAQRLEFGRRTLSALLPQTMLCLADSAFNAAELTSLGYENVQVCGLLIDTAGLTLASPDRCVMEQASRRSGPSILHVGQLFPHKRADYAISAFGRLVEDYVPDAHLTIVGTPRLHRYVESLHVLVDHLALNDRVTFTGTVSQSVLNAHFRSADVMVTASEHEGFCVPILEAMSFGLPVVARNFGAIAETSAGAAVIVPQSVGPDGFAHAISEVLTDPELADGLRERGRVRASEFTLIRSGCEFLRAMSNSLDRVC